MPDLTNKQRSSTVRLVGSDEANAVDVFDVGGNKTVAVQQQGPIDVQGEVQVEGSTISGAGLKTYIVDSPVIALTQSFVDYVDSTGQGLLYGWKFQFSNDQVEMRLIIDGNTAFTLSPTFLRDLNFESFTDVGLSKFFGAQQFGEFEFFPNQAIKYDTRLQIQARKIPSWGIDIDKALALYS